MGTFKTDETSKKDYGSEIVKTTGHVSTYTITSTTGTWTNGTYYDMEQTSTDGDGKNLIATLVIQSGSVYSITIVNSGFGYVDTEEVTFTEPGTSNTFLLTVDSVKEYTGRLDRYVEINAVDGYGTVTSVTTHANDPRQRYIQSWQLDDGGWGYTEPPFAYTLNKNGVSTAQFTTFGSYIGGIKTVKVTSNGLADETTSVVLKDTSHKEIYLSADFTDDDYRVGDKVYQGGAYDPATGVTGTIVGVNPYPYIDQLNIITIEYSTGTWAAATNVNNTRTSANTSTLPAGAIAKFVGEYDVTGDGWINDQASQSATLAVNSGTGWDITYSTSGGSHRLYFQASTNFTVGNYLFQGTDWLTTADAFALVTDVSNQGNGASSYIVVTNITENQGGSTPPTSGSLAKNTVTYEVPVTKGRIKTILELNPTDLPWLNSTWMDSNATYLNQAPDANKSDTEGTGAEFTIVVTSGEPVFTIETESTNEGTKSKGSGYAVGDTLHFDDPHASGTNWAKLRVTEVEDTTGKVSQGTTVNTDNFLMGHSDATTLTVNRKSAVADMGSGFVVTDTPSLPDAGHNATANINLELLRVPQDGTTIPESNMYSKATATVQYGAIVDKKGIHQDRKSHLNELAKMSDGVEYQEWSYGVQTAVNPDEWMTIAKDLFHTAGSLMIPNFTIDVEHDNTATSTTVVSTTP